MSDAKKRVKQLASDLGLEIPEDRLQQVAESWEATLAEIEVARVQPTEFPNPGSYDPAWSEKR